MVGCTCRKSIGAALALLCICAMLRCYSGSSVAWVVSSQGVFLVIDHIRIRKDVARRLARGNLNLTGGRFSLEEEIEKERNKSTPQIDAIRKKLRAKLLVK